ncbi:hypothetical protein [Soonwooa sp.]|uniref:hypothetical protein n=1 Tax=Soonwooa sp. TaxID=1938592 RepID=UPI002632EA45|nr:hypothetical protein [Soonwooa sp.]
MHSTNLYLDIDGVILTSKNTKPSNNSKELLEYITCNFNCFWLTTHCKGETDTTLNYLNEYFDNEIVELLKKIKPTNWTTLKTEGIDFKTDFIWLDDYPFDSEKKVLNENFCINKLIEINLDRDNELINVIQKLKNMKEKK